MGDAGARVRLSPIRGLHAYGPLTVVVSVQRDENDGKNADADDNDEDPVR